MLVANEAERQPSDLGLSERIIRALMRSNAGWAGGAKRFIGFILNPTALRIPGLLRPVFAIAYHLRWTVHSFFRFVISFARAGMFQSRCAVFGRGVRMQGPMPFVLGYPRIEVGDDCYIGGKVSIISGRSFDQPRFVMENRAEIGWCCTVVAAREVVIEQGARVAGDCIISDTDGHPREADRRFANEPPDLKDIRPVRIGRYAWIGRNSHIMKGVTIGEGAIVAANSVVISSVPPYALAMGNPAEILIKNYGMPAAMKKQRNDAPGARA